MLDTICDVLKAAYKRNWISTRDGNASFRRKNENFIYVTPSGVRKQHLNAEMMIKMKLDDNILDKHDPWNYVYRVEDDYQNKIIGLQPTGELALHVLLQKIIPENRVVLHLHPTYIIAAMYSGLDLQKISQDFPEINRYTRVGSNIPILPPISKELAIESVKKLNLNEKTGDVDFDIIGLDRHGIIAIGKDAWNVFEHVERVEHICQIVLTSKCKM